LAAGGGLPRVIARRIPLGLLDRPDQFSLAELAGLDAMLFSDLFDVVQLHVRSLPAKLIVESVYPQFGAGQMSGAKNPRRETGGAFLSIMASGFQESASGLARRCSPVLSALMCS